jgi:hypothetical protein
VKRKSKLNKEKERFWRKNLALLTESGLGQAEFCRRHDLNQNTLSWWKREINRRDETKSTTGARAKPIPFVPVVSDGIQLFSTEKRDELELPIVEIDLERKTVRIFKSVGSENLRALVSALLDMAP